MIGSFPELLEAAQSGDEDAFLALFRSLHPGLLRYLAALAGPAAEDIAADTWVGVVRNLGGFTGDEAGFAAWVFTIARARLRDEQRRAYRRPAPVDADQMLAGHPDGLDVAAEAEESAGTAAALRLIASLPRDQAEAVLLRYVVGLDVAQTALVLRKRPGAVRVASHRGLQRLRGLLEEVTAATDNLPGGAVTAGDLRAIGEVT